MAISTGQDGDTTTTDRSRTQPDNNDVSDLKQKRQQQQQQQNKPQTGSHERKPKTPKSETIRSILLLTLAIIDTYVLPGPTRTTIIETVNAHPILTTFLAAQLAVAFFPLLLFSIGVLTVGVVAAALFACLGMVVLVPVLLATGVLGVVVWGWGWCVFFVGRWAWGVYVERKLGGADGGGGFNGGGPAVVKSEPVDENNGHEERRNGDSGKKWQFKAGFGDKWMVFG